MTVFDGEITTVGEVALSSITGVGSEEAAGKATAGIMNDAKKGIDRKHRIPPDSFILMDFLEYPPKMWDTTERLLGNAFENMPRSICRVTQYLPPKVVVDFFLFKYSSSLVRRALHLDRKSGYILP